MGTINTVEALRSLIGEPRPTTQAKIQSRIDAQAAEFIRTSPFAVVATFDRNGVVEASPKGDEPGFVEIEDDQTLLVPERAGNNLAFGLQNILQTGRIGLIFLKPGTGETLRITGRAELRDDAELLARLGTAQRPALLATRISVERCYFHCARSMLRSQLWSPGSWPDPQKIRFGRIIAQSVGGDDAMADAIDTRVQQGYTTNLWRNS